MRRSLRTNAMWALCAWVGLGFAGTAQAQTGVSDDRVSLPEGPGSLEGVGENMEMDLNMGAMRYAVRVSVPSGFPSVTPNLDLSYNSGSGGSVAGIGWSMATPCVERMTYRGLPEYDTDDDFAAGGGEQLVKLPGTEPPVYRARFEGGFVRYTWMAVGDGAEGYWLAEYPDGSRGAFGATLDGALVETAREGGDEGTFRYMLVEKVDVHGHKMVMEYQKDGFLSLVSRIAYVFVDDVPRYEVELSYEPRTDDDTVQVDYLSDAKPGYEELLTQRLASVQALNRGQVMRRTVFRYERYADSGGFTRLRQVEMSGADGGTFDVRHDFAYSTTLGLARCEDDDQACAEPFLMDMGSLGVGFANGRATLLDINGDALPDIVDTSQSGGHRFFLNIAEAGGGAHFDPTPRLSEVGTQSSHLLGSATVQVLDVNGDGFTDLINAGTGQVLINRGSGDWEDDSSMQGTEDLAAALTQDFDADEGGLQSLRFIDINNDKRIDVIRATSAATDLFINGAATFEQVSGATPIGLGFDEANLDLADMNGDGLLDITRLQPSALSYRLNLGRGRWAEWVNASVELTEAQVEQTSVEDINGDAMADLVVVQGNSVSFALNTGVDRFAGLTQITSADVAGSIPTRDSATTVLYADMNGNGTSDVVWISGGGDVTALELFPLRPNLLTRATNGIGAVSEVTYTTSAVQMALDGGWQTQRYRVPFPMIVVASVDNYDLFTNLHDLNTFRYHDGYYDGVEKQFRGYERVESMGSASDSQEAGRSEVVFNVGAEDTYAHGLKLSEALYSADRPLTIIEHTYADCDVAEIPDGTDLPVRHVCMTRKRTTHKEGLDASRWVVVESAMEYNGYGNVTLSSSLGVTSIGGAGCGACEGAADEFGAPCDRGGDLCVGDEVFTETDYITPGDDTDGLWLLGLPWRVRTRGRLGDPLATETLTYYDGIAFEGLELGRLTRGDATRVTEKITADSEEVIETSRVGHDRHGNVRELVDPLGEPDLHLHRRRFTYDETGLRVTRLEDLLQDREGRDIRLRRDFAYEPLFDRVRTSTDWQLVRDDTPQGAPRETRYAYDEFGRLTARTLPGDTDAAPTEVFSYELGDPVSRIIIQRRTEAGGPLDLEGIQCLDGKGRKIQRRSRLEEGLYQVTDLTHFNIRSQVVRLHQPYQSDSARCDLDVTDVSYLSNRYDAAGRPLEVIHPDGDLADGASITRVVYEPLKTITYDAEDNDPASPHADTPSVDERDGLGRLVATSRLLTAGGEPARTTLQYDGLGRLTAITDPAGHVKTQSYDLLGRVTRISDPNQSGAHTYTYDAVGNVIREVDPRGEVTLKAYDGINRPVATWREGDRDGTLIEMVLDEPRDCPEELCTFGAGRVVEISYPDTESGERASEWFGYTERNLTRYISRLVDGFRFAFQYRFDNADRVIAREYPDGRTIPLRWDGASRLTGVPGVVDTIEFDERNLLLGMRHADGTVTEAAHDALMRPTRSVTLDAAADILQGFAYTQDRIGNLRTVTDLTEPTTAIRHDARVTYDAWYRVLEVGLGPDGDDEVLTWRYDIIDNVLERSSSLGERSPDHVGAYTYAGIGPNAVTQVGELSLDYDDAGNMTTRGGAALTWDYLERLVQVSGDTSFRAVYGSDRRRIARLREDGQRSLYPSVDFEVHDGIASLYVSAAGRLVARLDSDALATALLTDHNRNDRIDAADAWAASRGEPGSDPDALLWSSLRHLLLEVGPDDGATHLHTDHLGSVTLATGLEGGAQTVLGRRAFYPTGSDRGQIGHVDERGFTGQIHDPNGFIHFTNRTYDPRLGRWLSPDPFFTRLTPEQTRYSGEATSGYAYVGNNPMSAYDMAGLLRALYSPAADYSKDAAISNTIETRYLDGSHPSTAVNREDFGAKGSGVFSAIAERQKNSKDENARLTELDIVGHSNLGWGIGTSSDNSNPAQLVTALEKDGLTPAMADGLTIYLYSCNSGSSIHYTGAPRSATEPFALRFIRALKDAGYNNVKVVGYKGFVDDISKIYDRGNLVTKKVKNSKGPAPDADLASMHVTYSLQTDPKTGKVEIGKPKGKPSKVKSGKNPANLKVHSK